MAEGEGAWASGTQGRDWRIDQTADGWVARVRDANGHEKQSKPYEKKDSALHWAKRRSGAMQRDKQESSLSWHYGHE